MKKYSVQQYEDKDYQQWNAFIGKAKNATFLFHRDFIEYHKNNFQDNSLLIFEADRCVALLPANRVGSTIFSHQGLSYGGLVYTHKMHLEDVLFCFAAVLLFLKEKGSDQMYLKIIPSFYHKKPADEILYALFLAAAKIVRRDTSAVIDLTKKISFSKLRQRGIQKGITHDLIVKEESDFEPFWNQILIPNLAARHNTKPVHSIDEIVFLKHKFPLNIRQFNVYYQGQIVAGTTVFETATVAHCQYISKFEKGKKLGSLDFLYAYLIQNVFAEKQYFDFGISNEDQGMKLNGGLSAWKESFGASTIVHDVYEIATVNYSQLENVII